MDRITTLNSSFHDSGGPAGDHHDNSTMSIAAPPFEQQHQLQQSQQQYDIRPHQFHHQAASRVPNIVVQIPIHSADENHAHHQHHQSATSTTNNTYPHLQRFYNGHSTHQQQQKQQQQQHQQHHPQQHRAGCSSSNNSNEIKSEPIKFELDPHSSTAKAPPAPVAACSVAPLQLAPTADTSTLVTARPKVTVVAAAVAAAANNSVPTTTANPAMTVDATAATAPAAAIRCLRCSSCPFISITQAALDQHVRDRHQSPTVGGPNAQPTVERRKLACPGCENVFYSRMSLEAHLLNDHQMGADDIAVLLQSLLTESGTATATVTKQKIYLKNVEILRNPVYNLTTNGGSSGTAGDSGTSTESTMFSNVHSVHDVHDCLPLAVDAADTETGHYYPMHGHSGNFETTDTTTGHEIADTHNADDGDMCVIDDYQEPIDPDDFIDLIDDEYDETECTEDVMQPTIFVKHDMLLKNPPTFYRTYATVAAPPAQQQHHTIDLIETPPPQSQQPAAYAGMGNGMQSLYDFTAANNNYLDVPQYTANSAISSTGNHQRRPGKIFIKNVDILKQPMFVHSSSTTATLSTSMSPQPQPMFVPTYAISVNGRSEFPTNILSTSPRLLDNKTPLPMPQPKQIFIKNIDILKEPTMFSIANATTGSRLSCDPNASATPLATTAGAYATGASLHYHVDEAPAPVPAAAPRRNALHLRTVEELNLNTETINKESESRLTTLNLRSDEPQLLGNVAKAGTLHLRTVDQLNLMNINEVQNLIENFQEEPTAAVPPIGQQQQQQQQQSQSLQPGLVQSETSVDDHIDDGQPKEEPKKPVVDAFDDVHVFNDYRNASFQSATQTFDAVLQELQHTAAGSEIAGHYTPGEDLDKYAYAADVFAQGGTHFVQSTSGSSSAVAAPITVNDGDTNEAECPDADVAIIESSNCSLDDNAGHTGKTAVALAPTSAATSPDYWYNDDASDQPDTFHGIHATTQSDALPAATIHLSENSILEYAKEFDESMLFVCAQEFIGSDECGVPENGGSGAEPTMELPLPPLLPFDALRTVSDEVTMVSDSEADDETPRKGRIYVVNNLMKTTAAASEDVVLITEPMARRKRSGGARSRGRRKIVKAQQASTDDKLNGPSATAPAGHATVAAVGRHRCSQARCVMQFGSAALLIYHERCHGPAGSLICPECSCSTAEVHATDPAYRSWNTLHTHLWRQHAIDMELYSCTLCNFKTPIRSRLTNTHARIHSEERNYKCDQCTKAFKNAKQLKNHRRTHLETGGGAPKAPASASADATTATAVKKVHQCRHCERLFYSRRHLRNHERSLHEGVVQFRCDVCQAVCSSLGAKRTHMRNHETASRKQHRCGECAYETNDYNAFRRHRRTHAVDETGGAGVAMPYQCPFCAYGSIQSTTYARHVQRDHPDEAPELVFACGRCKFITVNRLKFALHVRNHDAMRPTAADTTAAATTPSTSNTGSTSGKRIKVRTGLTEASPAGDTTDELC